MRERGRSKPVLFLPSLCLLLSLSLACRKNDPGTETVSPGETQRAGRIVLEIQGVTYSDADFQEYVRSTIGGSGKSLAIPALSRLYDDFVEEKLFLRRARDQNVVLTDDEKSDYLAKLKRAMGVDNNKPEPAISGETVLFEHLLVEKYLSLLVKNISIEDEDISGFYSQHKSDYLQPERVQVSQILLASEGKATEVRGRLKDADEAQFRTMARAESAGPEAVKGGVMGVFSAGQLPPELEKFIFPLNAGEISQVVGSSYGYHIFRVDKKFEARLISPAEAAPAIRANLLDQKSKEAVAAHLEELKAAMDWKSYPENLSFAYQRNECP
jgi:parvulin-like peptidyl-prolyl isomerase